MKMNEPFVESPRPIGGWEAYCAAARELARGRADASEKSENETDDANHR